jgi:hypothetical protein
MTLAPLWPEIWQRPVLGQEAQAISMKNALVALTPQRHDPAAAQSDLRASSHRPNADFVAHLIAMAVQAPQTRARRAEPLDALAAYGSLGQWPSEPGRMVSRSL